MCNDANVKKLAASVQTYDSSISSLQEDETNKLRVTTYMLAVYTSYTKKDLNAARVHVLAGLCSRLKHLRAPLMNCERRG